MMKAVLFDYDGVIADSMDVVYDVTSDFMSSHGARMKKQHMYHGDLKSIFRLLGVDENKMKDFVPIFKRHMAERMKEIPVFKGMDIVIKRLSNNFKLGIVSNGFSSFIEPHLEAHGLRKYINCIVDGTEEKIKPDPYQIFKCLNVLDIKPSDACFVGDTETDIIAARRAGIGKVIGVSYGYYNVENLSDVDLIIHKPEELLEVVQ